MKGEGWFWGSSVPAEYLSWLDYVSRRMRSISALRSAISFSSRGISRGVIGLCSSGLEELLEALNLVFGDFDLFLLFLVESHLSGNPP